MSAEVRQLRHPGELHMRQGAPMNESKISAALIASRSKIKVIDFDKKVIAAGPLVWSDIGNLAVQDGEIVRVIPKGSYFYWEYDRSIS